MSYSVHGFRAGDRLRAVQLNEMDSQIKQNEAELAKVNKGVALKKVWFDYSSYLAGAATLEENARILAGYDLIVGGGVVAASPEGTNDNYNAILAAKKLNPNMKFFWYIGVASSRDGNEVGDNGVWDPNSQDVPIMENQQILQAVHDALHVGGQKSSTPDANGIYQMTGGIRFDGIFWDEFDMDTEAGVKNQGYNTWTKQYNWTTNQEKDKFLIEYARALGLTSFVNGWSMNGKDYLTAEDYFCLESNETRCSFTSDGKVYWTNLATSNRLYDYYKNYYGQYVNEYGDKLTAECVPLSYVDTNTTYDEMYKIITWCCFVALAQGGKYIAIHDNAGLNKKLPHNWQVPDMTTMFYAEGAKSITRLADNIYELKANGNTLRTYRNVSGGTDGYGGQRVCDSATLDRVTIEVNGMVMQDAMTPEPVKSYEAQKRLNTLESDVEGVREDLVSKDFAPIYHRMMIDDWGKEYIYTNFITENVFTQFVNSLGAFTITSSDPEKRALQMTANTFEGGWQNGVYMNVPLRAAMAGHTLEIGVSGTWDSNNNTICVQGAVAYHRFVSGGSQASQYMKDFTGGIYTVTLADDISDDSEIQFAIYYRSASTYTLNGLYVIDVGEFEKDMSKNWYTNIFGDISSYHDYMGSSTPPYTMSEIDNVGKDFKITYKENGFSNGAGISIPMTPGAGFFKAGHTYEFGAKKYESNTANIQMAAYIRGTTEVSARLDRSKVARSMIWKDERPCVRFTLPEGYVFSNMSMYVNCNSNDALTSEGSAKYADVEGLYFYDCDEEDIVIRGEMASNSYLRICRVTEEALAIDSKLLPDALYITDSGRLFVTDFVGRKVDIVLGS